MNPRGPGHGRMKRTVLYSRAGPARSDSPSTKAALSNTEASSAPAENQQSQPRRRVAERLLLISTGALIVVLTLLGKNVFFPGSVPIDGTDLDARIQQQVQAFAMISPAVHAHQVIRPSVVRIRGHGPDLEDDQSSQPPEGSIGTGVVIVDDGTILTNLHVVSAAERISVVFADGFESDARLVGAQPENDLAVLQAHEIPDGLVAATLRSTTHLALGERVVAVGFPFGLGPSVSAGVVSGLRREFVSPEGQRVLTNLIQFDAAANPGSSGGPLVTSDGEVVGIVTGILNPRRQGVFVGIGFAVPIENAAGAAGVSPF